jgi:diacylglycerol O-acyltransferase-1
VSAIFHEFAVSIPLKMLRWHSFVGMLAQVPLVLITDWASAALSRGSPTATQMSFWVCNGTLWLSFCLVGQPLGLILYYNDWSNA